MFRMSRVCLVEKSVNWMGRCRALSYANVKGFKKVGLSAALFQEELDHLNEKHKARATYSNEVLNLKIKHLDKKRGVNMDHLFEKHQLTVAHLKEIYGKEAHESNCGAAHADKFSVFLPSESDEAARVAAEKQTAQAAAATAVAENDLLRSSDDTFASAICADNATQFTPEFADRIVNILLLAREEDASVVERILTGVNAVTDSDKSLDSAKNLNNAGLSSVLPLVLATHMSNKVIVRYVAEIVLKRRTAVQNLHDSISREDYCAGEVWFKMAERAVADDSTPYSVANYLVSIVNDFAQHSKVANDRFLQSNMCAEEQQVAELMEREFASDDNMGDGGEMGECDVWEEWEDEEEDWEEDGDDEDWDDDFVEEKRV